MGPGELVVLHELAASGEQIDAIANSRAFQSLLALPDTQMALAQLMQPDPVLGPRTRSKTIVFSTIAYSFSSTVPPQTVDRLPGWSTTVTTAPSSQRTSVSW